MHKFVLRSMVLILSNFFLLFQFVPTNAAAGEAWITVDSNYPIARLQVSGENQYGDIATWPNIEAPQELGGVFRWEINGYWWRFKHYSPACADIFDVLGGCPEWNQLGPTLWIWFTDGTFQTQRCQENISFDDDDVTCHITKTTSVEDDDGDSDGGMNDNGDTGGTGQPPVDNLQVVIGTIDQEFKGLLPDNRIQADIERSTLVGIRVRVLVTRNGVPEPFARLTLSLNGILLTGSFEAQEDGTYTDIFRLIQPAPITANGSTYTAILQATATTSDGSLSATSSPFTLYSVTQTGSRSHAFTDLEARVWGTGLEGNSPRYFQDSGYIDNMLQNDSLWRMANEVTLRAGGEVCAEAGVVVSSIEACGDVGADFTTNGPLIQEFLVSVLYHCGGTENCSYDINSGDQVVFATFRYFRNGFPTVHLYQEQIIRNETTVELRMVWVKEGERINNAWREGGDFHQIRQGSAIFSLESPAVLYITDPLGRSSGYDPNTNERVFGFRTNLSESGEEPFYLVAPNPPSGEYQIQVIGTGSGEYTFSTLGTDAEGNGTQEIRVTALTELDYITRFRANYDYETGTITRLAVEGTVDIVPRTLNVCSHGGQNSLTAFVELPLGFDIEQVDPTTVFINGTAQGQSHPTSIGDHNGNHIPDMMIKFDRQDVIATLTQTGNVTINVNGVYIAPVEFIASDTVRVIQRGNCEPPTAEATASVTPVSDQQVDADEGLVSTEIAVISSDVTPTATSLAETPTEVATEATPSPTTETPTETATEATPSPTTETSVATEATPIPITPTPEPTTPPLPVIDLSCVTHNGAHNDLESHLNDVSQFLHAVDVHESNGNIDAACANSLRQMANP